MKKKNNIRFKMKLNVNRFDVKKQVKKIWKAFRITLKRKLLHGNILSYLP